MDDDGIGWFGKDQSGMASLKETLHSQQSLLQKLYNELEVEREASSTAASEALSMILRLQGEKAAVKMEAEQYKRLVEEKMCHAEESLSIFEELIYQKELEVASLDYQVQAYRYKLVSLGCTDPGIGEIKFPENLLQRNEDLSSSPKLSRISSPLRNFKLLTQKKGVTEREDSTSPDRDLIPYRYEDGEGKEVNDQFFDNGRRTANPSRVNSNTYFEQIRRLDDKVKDIAGVPLRSSTSSPFPLSDLNSEESSDGMRLFGMNESDYAKRPRDSSDSETNNDPNGSPGVLDVFEVPQADPDTKSNGKTVNFAPNDPVKLSDPIKDDALKPEVKVDVNCLKNLLLSHREKIITRPSENAIGCNAAIIMPTARLAIPQPKSIKRTRTSEIIEVGARRNEFSGGGEALILLSDIKQQLNTIQAEIINMNTKRSSALKEKEAVISYMETSLMEEMVTFWL